MNQTTKPVAPGFLDGFETEMFFGFLVAWHGYYFIQLAQFLLNSSLRLFKDILNQSRLHNPLVKDSIQNGLAQNFLADL